MSITEKEIYFLRSKLRMLEREIEKQVKSESGCCGVTVAQCHILMELDIHGEISIKELTDILELDKSTLSRTIDGLVDIGHVNRVINEDDRRFMKVSLSEKGKEKADFINKLCNDFYLKVFSLVLEEKHKTILDNVVILFDAMNKIRKSCFNGSCCK